MNSTEWRILLLAVVAASAALRAGRCHRPDGRVAVLVQPAPEGFSDGGR